MRSCNNLMAAGAVSLAAAFSIGDAAAVPLSLSRQGVTIFAQSDVIQVRSRRDPGAAIAAGVAGAIIGGIIASQGRSYYDYPYPVYPYHPYPVYRSYHYDPAAAYCMRRFRSYDPYSGTYVGYDGYRRYCP
jgi:hypothetical protein